MSELISAAIYKKDFHWHLLMTVSSLSLIGAGTAMAQASEPADRPTVWIEVGGQLERITAAQQIFAPLFTNQFLPDGLLSAADAGKGPRYSNGFEGSITVDPAESGWAFKASVRYGRSNTTRSSHHQVT